MLYSQNHVSVATCIDNSLSGSCDMCWQHRTPLLPAQKAACWIIIFGALRRNDLNFYFEMPQVYFEKPLEFWQGSKEALVNTDEAWWRSRLTRFLLECIRSGHSHTALRGCTYHWS